MWYISIAAQVINTKGYRRNAQNAYDETIAGWRGADGWTDESEGSGGKYRTGKGKADMKHLGWPVLNKDNTQTRAEGLEKVRGEEGGYNADWIKNKIEKDEGICTNDGATTLRYQQQQ